MSEAKMHYVTARVSQLDVGQLEIFQMGAYCPSVEIHSLKEGVPAGWGKQIFKGTLEELIDFITTRLQKGR